MGPPLNISICNNNSAKTGLTVTDLDIRNRLICSSKSVTSRPQNGPQMLQIETEESFPDFKSQSVIHRTDFPLLLLQIKINGGAVWHHLNLQHMEPSSSAYCYRTRQTSDTRGGRRGHRWPRVSPRLPLAGAAGLFAALPPRWGCADRRIVLLTACQLVWEAL